MKAITVHQPFAQYLADGIKRYETRGWNTNYRGLVLIHAGKTWNDDLATQASLLSRRYKDIPLVEKPVLGVILAVAILEDCVRSENLRPTLSQAEAAMGNYANGRYGWRMRIVERFDEAIPASGQQGLWDWDWHQDTRTRGKRVAIVGSRKYKPLDDVVDYVKGLPRDTIIISGGAQGVDLAAEKTAKERGMQVISFPVNTYNLPKIWKDRQWEYGRRAKERNQYIVEMAETVTAYWDEESSGTQDSINKAKKLGRPVEINPVKQPEQITLVQKTLDGFDHYDESAYIVASKAKAESSKELPAFEWDKPWLIDDKHVWVFDGWENGERHYRPALMTSDAAKKTANCIRGCMYASETIVLRRWLDIQLGWHDVPYDVVDVGDMASDYFIRKGSVHRSVPMESIHLTQEQYNVAIAKDYWRSMRCYDADGLLPYGIQFADSDNVYILDGTHRTLAHKWSGRESMSVDVNFFDETFSQACSMIELDEEDEMVAEVLEEALDILLGELEYVL